MAEIPDLDVSKFEFEKNQFVYANLTCYSKLFYMPYIFEFPHFSADSKLLVRKYSKSG